MAQSDRNNVFSCKFKEGPSVAEMIEILGKQNALQRLEIFLKNNKR